MLWLFLPKRTNDLGKKLNAISQPNQMHLRIRLNLSARSHKIPRNNQALSQKRLGNKNYREENTSIIITMNIAKYKNNISKTDTP
jgi:hypothetical protein